MGFLIRGGRVGNGGVRIAADSTMFLIVNLLIALSLGVQREQLEHRIGLTWPRPFLLRPLGRLVSAAFRKSAGAGLLGRSLLNHDCGLLKTEDSCDMQHRSLKSSSGYRGGWA